MKHNRQIGKVLIDELSNSADFVLLFYAEWSPAPVWGLDILSKLLSKEKYNHIDLLVIDIDNEFYNGVKTRFNLPMSHGWGEIYFFKNNKNIAPMTSSPSIIIEDLATKLDFIYCK